ncbi:uncharacterized protein LOC126329915 [Schistocerca gregaria]|uniref:uncharacterized protein LOC126329915 n=1 Tax=Schistocerca gregaria TaxID=7010 RepID=UPI00211DF590|nr:uncharacterized protein LOC126329915 [Schistocerca gregaria]
MSSHQESNVVKKLPEEPRYQQYNQLQSNNSIIPAEMSQAGLQQNRNNELFYNSTSHDSLASNIQGSCSLDYANRNFGCNGDRNVDQNSLAHNYSYTAQTNQPQPYQHTRLDEYQSPLPSSQQPHLDQFSQNRLVQAQPNQYQPHPANSERPQPDLDRINRLSVQFNTPKTQLVQPNQSQPQPYAAQQSDQQSWPMRQFNQSQAYLTQPAYNQSAGSYPPAQSSDQSQRYAQMQPPYQPTSGANPQLYNQSHVQPPQSAGQPQPYLQIKQPSQPKTSQHYLTNQFNQSPSNSAQQYSYQQPQRYTQTPNQPQPYLPQPSGQPQLYSQQTRPSGQPQPYYFQQPQPSDQPQPYSQQTQSPNRVYQQPYSTQLPSYPQTQQQPQHYAQNPPNRLHAQGRLSDPPQPYVQQQAQSSNQQLFNQLQPHSSTQPPGRSQPYLPPGQPQSYTPSLSHPQPCPPQQPNESQPYTQLPSNPSQSHAQTQLPGQMQSYAQKPSDELKKYESSQFGPPRSDFPVSSSQFYSAQSGVADQCQTRPGEQKPYLVEQNSESQKISSESQQPLSQKDCFSDELRHLKLSDARNAAEVKPGDNRFQPNQIGGPSAEKARQLQPEGLNDRIAQSELKGDNRGALPRGLGEQLESTRQSELRSQFADTSQREKTRRDPREPVALPDHTQPKQSMHSELDYSNKVEDQSYLSPLKGRRNWPTEGEKDTLRRLLGEGGNIIHSYSAEEVSIFTRYINFLLKDDRSLEVLPIKPNCEDLLSVTADGVLICKLINRVKPGIINDKYITLNPTSDIQRIENHKLAIAGSSAIGCKVVNIGPYDILEKRAYLTIAFIWQIIRTYLFSKVSSNSRNHPELVASAEMGGDSKGVLNKKPEDMLIMWFNSRLKMARHNRQVANLGSDIADGECYLVLLSQIAPHVVPRGVHLQVRDAGKRAKMVCDYIDRICGFRPLEPSDVLRGNEELNTAACAALFDCSLSMDVETKTGDARAQEEDRLSSEAKREQEEAERRLKWAEEEKRRLLELKYKEHSVKENLKRLEEETLHQLEEEKNRKMRELAMQEEQLKLRQAESDKRMREEQMKLNQMLNQVKQFEANLQYQRDAEKERLSRIENDLHRQDELRRMQQEQERARLEQARRDHQQRQMELNRYIHTIVPVDYGVESNRDREHHYEIPKVNTTAEKNKVPSLASGISWPIGRLQICIVEARRLAKLSALDPDPYVCVTFGDMRIKTPIARGTLDPAWNFTFDLRQVNYHHEIVFQVLDYRLMVKDAFLGQVKLTGSDISKFSERWYQLQSRQYKLTKVQGELFIRLSIVT